METFLLGLAIFVGIHSIRIVADGWRSRQIERFGAGPWKLVYSVASLVGLMLLGRGYQAAQQASTVFWMAPPGLRHVTALLTLAAFILVVAAYASNNAIKRRVGHPMVLGIALWSLGHLLVNGSTAEIILFGGFFIWSTASFIAAHRRDREAVAADAPNSAAATAATLIIGVAAWAAFAFWLHRVLIGVQPLP
ncbi:Uncharacterized membrane protein [Noviherbaspirillum humi]|uniref:Uncharacterized membrane protein n=1 Tax=Noviherbaspirillum humi TaxID=1688639 RepID=A0A239F3E3_9BURK|nr:NnrU family protein [Noviherbaspirillum humi]SNS51409.1 Uncharacterized membrane protein [Noviherbaspirillum humi]